MLDRICATNATGRLGEIIVAFHLEANGVQTAVVDREEIDLWVRTPTGRMLTVQVKTAGEPKAKAPSRAIVRKHYCFHMPSKTTADLYALVALDVGLVLFFNNTINFRSLQPDIFTKEAMIASIAEHLS